MQVQDVMNQVCNGISSFASTVGNGAVTAASWLGRQVTVVGSALASFASKVATFVAPFFGQAKDFVVANKGPILIAGVAAIGGAALYALFSNACRGESTSAPKAPAKA